VRLIPRDEQFYDLFTQLAERLTRSAQLLLQLFQEPQHRAQHVASIKSAEHEADGLTHEIIDRLDRTFITPFDREDIHQLASKLDDVVDLLDGAARRVDIFKIHEIHRPAIVLSEVVVRAATQVEAAVRNMKDGRLVNAKARELKKLEEEGDALYHDAMGALFAQATDPIAVIKWKELYDNIEDALDQCEDVANVLQSIALKNT
jgi:predicted phosphate transport protein (TIGR00153 family)